MNRQKKRNILIVVSLLTIAFFVFTYLYLSKINIYRKISLEVYQDNSNLTENFTCKGYSVFNSELDLLIDTSRLNFKVPSKTWLNRIEISAKSPSDSIQYNLKLSYDNTVLLDTLFYQKITIDSIYENDNRIEKLKLVLLSNFKHIEMLMCIFFIFLCVILFIKHKDLLFTRISSISIQSVREIDLFLLILLSILFICATIWFFYAFISDTFSLWAGLFSQITIFCILLLIMHFLLRKKHKKRKNILTSLTSIIVTLLIVEVVLRIIGYNTTSFEKYKSFYISVYDKNVIKDYYIHEKNSTAYMQKEEFSYKRKTNSLGLSDEELVIDTTKELIIALGDSFTEGDGAHSDSTWLKFLERDYNSKENHNYKFFNAGICSSDPFYEYRLLKDKLVEYQPKIVIVCYGYDLNDVIIRGGMERFDSYNIALGKKWWEVIYKHSFTFRLIIRNIFGYNYLLLTEDEYITEKERALIQLKESIDLFYNLSKEENFDLVVVFYPFKHELRNGEFDSNYILIDYCKEKDINVLDLLDYYSNTLLITGDQANQYYWTKDGHNNSKGYEIFAEGVFSKLEEMGY